MEVQEESFFPASGYAIFVTVLHIYWIGPMGFNSNGPKAKLYA